MKDPPVNLAMALNWGQEHELRSTWVDLSDLIFFSKRIAEVTLRYHRLSRRAIWLYLYYFLFPGRHRRSRAPTRHTASEVELLVWAFQILDESPHSRRTSATEKAPMQSEYS